MSTFTQTVWTKNEAHVAHSMVIKIDTQEIEWVKYEIPVTSHSGGSADVFLWSDMYKDSVLYKSIIREFNSSVANEVLYSLQQLQSGKF